jgi:arginyl-tRNA synthetase
MINLSKKIEKNINDKLNLSEKITIVQSKIDLYDYTLVNTNKLNSQEKEILENELLEKINFDGFVIKKQNNFYNIVLEENFLFENFQKIVSNLNNSRLIEKIPSKEKIIIDYSSPNVAKEMHVG